MNRKAAESFDSAESSGRISEVVRSVNSEAGIFDAKLSW
jgi:hypothetical protein